MPITTTSKQHRQTLSEISRPFTSTAQELQSLLARMKQAMTLANGDGIAAIQIGEPVRVFLFKRYDLPGEPVQVAVNPEIHTYSERLIGSWDGCLSVPGGVGRVPRYEQIDVAYYDEFNRYKEERLSGLTGIIFQHEIDHLNGRLFTAYIPDARLLPLSEYFDLYDELEQQCEDQALSETECRELADQHWHRLNPETPE